MLPQPIIPNIQYLFTEMVHKEPFSLIKEPISNFRILYQHLAFKILTVLHLVCMCVYVYVWLCLCDSTFIMIHTYFLKTAVIWFISTILSIKIATITAAAT